MRPNNGVTRQRQTAREGGTQSHGAHRARRVAKDVAQASNHIPHPPHGAPPGARRRRRRGQEAPRARQGAGRAGVRQRRSRRHRGQPPRDPRRDPLPAQPDPGRERPARPAREQEAAQGRARPLARHGQGQLLRAHHARGRDDGRPHPARQVRPRGPGLGAGRRTLPGVRIVDAGRCTTKRHSGGATGRFGGCRSCAARRRHAVVGVVRSAISSRGSLRRA